jgi:sugar phosphate permease
LIVNQVVRSSRVHYAWIIFVVAFVTLLFASGTRSTPSILMVPLENEFGWTRATVSLAVSINLVLFGFVGPFAAAMMNRWGIQRVVASALVFVASGAALTTRMTEPWQLYLLWGVVVGIGAGTMATVFAATVANRWFVAKRGLVVGILTAASATGQLIFLPLFGWLAQAQGWRYVSLTVALCTLAVVPLVLIFMRDRPESVGIRAYGAKEDDPPAPVRANPIAAALLTLAAFSSFITA